MSELVLTADVMEKVVRLHSDHSVMNLSNNNIVAVQDPNAFEPVAESLVALDLSYNLLTVVSDSFASLQVLENLDLSSNRIETISNLKYLRSLKRLNLSFNSISRWEQLEEISPHLQQLEYLDIQGNPVLQNLPESQSYVLLRSFFPNAFEAFPGYEMSPESASESVALLETSSAPPSNEVGGSKVSEPVSVSEVVESKSGSPSRPTPNMPPSLLSSPSPDQDSSSVVMASSGPSVSVLRARLQAAERVVAVQRKSLEDYETALAMSYAAVRRARKRASGSSETWETSVEMIVQRIVGGVESSLGTSVPSDSKENKLNSALSSAGGPSGDTEALEDDSDDGEEEESLESEVQWLVYCAALRMQRQQLADARVRMREAELRQREVEGMLSLHSDSLTAAARVRAEQQAQHDALLQELKVSGERVTGLEKECGRLRLLLASSSSKKATADTTGDEDADGALGLVTRQQAELVTLGAELAARDAQIRHLTRSNVTLSTQLAAAEAELTSLQQQVVESVSARRNALFGQERAEAELQPLRQSLAEVQAQLVSRTEELKRLGADAAQLRTRADGWERWWRTCVPTLMESVRTHATEQSTRMDALSAFIRDVGGHLSLRLARCTSTLEQLINLRDAQRADNEALASAVKSERSTWISVVKRLNRRQERERRKWLSDQSQESGLAEDEEEEEDDDQETLKDSEFLFDAMKYTDGLLSAFGASVASDSESLSDSESDSTSNSENESESSSNRDDDSEREPEDDSDSLSIHSSETSGAQSAASHEQALAPLDHAIKPLKASALARLTKIVKSQTQIIRSHSLERRLRLRRLEQRTAAAEGERDALRTQLQQQLQLADETLAAVQSSSSEQLQLLRAHALHMEEERDLAVQQALQLEEPLVLAKEQLSRLQNALDAAAEESAALKAQDKVLREELLRSTDLVKKLEIQAEEVDKRTRAEADLLRQERITLLNLINTQGMGLTLNNMFNSQLNAGNAAALPIFRGFGQQNTQ